MISLWEDTTKMPSFPKLDQDIKTDVLIIGGGMAGVLCAYMLNAAGVDYVLAEAESIGMGITKNTTAKITAQHGLIYKKLIKEFGIQKAKQYLDLNLRAVETFRTLCEDTDCGFENRNAYVYSISSREEIVEEINALKQLGYGEANGMYKNGKIVLALNNTGSVMSVYFGHELFRDLKQTAPKQANELQTYVLDCLKNNADYDYNARFASLEDTYAGSLRGKTESQKKSVIDEEIAANACFTVLSNENNFTALVKQNRSLAQKVRDFFADFVEKIKNALTRLAKNNAEYRALQNDTEAKEKILVMFNKALESSDINLNKSNEVKFSKVGKTDDGRTIYKTNYETHTPKAIKQQDIINLVQNVWSRLPIELNIVKNGKTVPILARFNPNLSERSDLSKIAFGNRKGNASEKRMTLDLASDLYSIAEEAQYVKSKAETGKNNPAHKNVSQWHYFITNLVYRDENNQDIDCYMNIDVKKTNDGNWFYSFAIEKGTAPQTLLAVVTDETSATVPTNSISNTDENVKFSLKTDSAGNKLSEQQQEYFKDSKVRDEEGRLLVVYHGTDTDFTVFDRTKARANMDIQGSFFSPWEIDAKGYGEKVDAYYLNIINPAPEGVAYKALNKFKGQNYAGVKARDFLERMGYDGVNNGNEEYIAFYPEQIKLVENTAPTDNSDIRYSLKEENDDYSYDTLVSKPDMPVTKIADGINYRAQGITRKDIVNDAVNNAKTVGRENENGNAVVYVYDIAKEIIVPKKAIQHSLDRRIEVNGPVVTNIGNILKNSIRINALIPRNDNIEQSYVLIGAAKSQQDEPFIVSFVVNEFTNEVKSIDVLYSVNEKKEPAGSSKSPQLSTAATGSKISISDLLDYVNRYYPDILPEDVLRHYGYTARPDGVIGESALYSLKEEDNTSIFEDNEELAESAADVQNMLHFVSTENSELRKAFDIRTVRQAEDSSVAKVAAYLRKQYDSSYKIQAAQTSNLLSYYVYLFCSGR